MFSKKQVQKTSDLSFSLTHQLEILLKEQRRQRADLSFLTRLVQGLVTDKTLQRQVDEFYDKPGSQEDLREPPLEDMAQDGNSSGN